MSILVGQQVISEEIEKIHADALAGETQPRLNFPPYSSAILRHPTREPRYADPPAGGDLAGQRGRPVRAPARPAPRAAGPELHRSITSERARARLIAAYDHESSQHDFLLGYWWDIVLTGGHATPAEDGDG